MISPHKSKANTSVESRQKQILSYTKILREYKISFNDLTGASPKNEATKSESIKIAKLISENTYLIARLNEQKQLPVKELNQFVTGQKKIIHNHKKYIIAIALIFISGFTYLEDYIQL